MVTETILEVVGYERTQRITLILSLLLEHVGAMKDVTPELITATLDQMELCDYRAHSDLFEEDLYNEISLESCVAKRISRGSTGYASVKEQLAYVEEKLK